MDGFQSGKEVMTDMRVAMGVAMMAAARKVEKESS